MVLQILLVSGIWPPAVGGPATHLPAFGRFLQNRGHAVKAVISTDTEPDPAPFPLDVLRADRSLPLRMAEGAARLARASRGADVTYATGLYARSAAATHLTRVPLVLKLVNDPAYERAKSLGIFEGDLEQFQAHTSDRRSAALKRLRDWTVRRADRVVVPSAYLASIIERWDRRIATPELIPNPRPTVTVPANRDALRRELGVVGLTAVFAGRLVQQKNLSLAIEALECVPGWKLVLVGDGPERASLEREIQRRGLQDRAVLAGAVSHDRVLDWLAAADFALLTSSWENHPHSLIEALAVGIPAIATAVGGVPEIVSPDRNGLLTPSGAVDELVAAIRRCVTEPRLLARLRKGAQEPTGLSQYESFSRLERVLESATGA